MSNRKARQGRKDVGKNQVDTYYFDIDKCKQCPLKEGCYKEGAKTKTYSVSINQRNIANRKCSKKVNTLRRRQYICDYYMEY